MVNEPGFAVHNLSTLPPVPWNPELSPDLDKDYPERLVAFRWFARKSLLKLGPAPTPGESRRFPEGSFLYFIQIHSGEIKIGAAKDVKRRMQTLQVGMPHPLKLLYAAPGLGELEREFHEQFADHNIQGEWFAPHPDILAEIERLKGEANG